VGILVINKDFNLFVLELKQILGLGKMNGFK